MIEERIDMLEIKFMEQDLLLNELNLIVTKQQAIIDSLIKIIKEKNENNTPAVENSKSLFEQLKDDKPPHY